MSASCKNELKEFGISKLQALVCLLDFILKNFIMLKFITDKALSRKNVCLRSFLLGLTQSLYLLASIYLVHIEYSMFCITPEIPWVMNLPCEIDLRPHSEAVVVTLLGILGIFWAHFTILTNGILIPGILIPEIIKKENS